MGEETQPEMIQTLEQTDRIPESPSYNFRIVTDKLLRYACLTHIVIQFLFIILFASLSDNVDLARKVNICVSMFVVVPVCVLGFVSTGGTFTLALRFNVNIVFISIVWIVGLVVCGLNVWIIVLDSVLAFVCLCVNIVMFVLLFIAGLVRIFAIRKEVKFIKENGGINTDEVTVVK